MADEFDEPDPRVLWRWVGAALRPWTGWIFIGVGALLMLAGYLGVSREALPARQIPYLVSGGIGGIFFAVLGAYFLGTQEMRKDSGRLDRLEGMVEDLHTALLTRPDAPQVSNGSRAASTDEAIAPERKVVVVPGGQLFHRAECALTEGKAASEVTPAAARKRGMRPCPTCAPAASVA
jgi:hypothetical protein